MSVAVHILPRDMSKETYDRLIAELEASGMGEPDGRLVHAAYGGDHLRIFEVWNSRDEFEPYRRALFEIVQAASFGHIPVQVEELRSLHEGSC